MAAVTDWFVKQKLLACTVLYVKNERHLKTNQKEWHVSLNSGDKQKVAAISADFRKNSKWSHQDTKGPGRNCFTEKPEVEKSRVRLPLKTKVVLFPSLFCIVNSVYVKPTTYKNKPKRVTYCRQTFKIKNCCKYEVPEVDCDLVNLLYLR